MNIVIIPIRASLPMTIQCVESLQAQDIPTTLYLIDNGSSDGCGPYIRSQEGIVQCYAKPKGLSAVWNRALNHCFDQLHLPHALVVNNDTILRPDTYRLLLADGGPFVTAIGVSTMEQTLSADPQSKRPHPDFSCFLIRREVLERVRGFDERMVTWASDNDMHVRMHRAGIDAHCISVPFYHVASGTLKTVDHETHVALCEQSDRDREAFRLKWGCLPGTKEYEALFTSGGM